MAKPRTPAPVPILAPLEPSDRAICALLALSPRGLHGEMLLTGATRLLTRLGLPAPKDEPALAARLKLCQAHRLALVETWGFVRCRPDATDGLLLHAWRQGWSQALREASENLQVGYPFDPTPSVSALRRALMTEAFETFQELVDQPKLPKNSPMAVLEAIAEAVPRPLDPDWLGHLPPATRSLVARALLDHALLTWEPLEPLVTWLGGAAAEDPARALHLEGLLHLGRFQEAEARFPPGPAEEGWPRALAAYRAFQEGRLEAAAAGFEAAWESLTAGTRRTRAQLLPGPLGWFHALALLATDQAAKAEPLARLYGGRGNLDLHSRVWTAILDLTLLAQGRRLDRAVEVAQRPERGPLEVLLQLHAAYWEDAARFRAADLGPLLRALGYLADPLGAPWIRAQVRALEQRWQGLAPEGNRALADFQELTPPWQRILDSLARLGQEADAPRAPRVAKPRRLAWVLRRSVSYGGYGAWSLEAREQRQDKGGAWSVGKLIPLHRVRSASVAMDFLQSADRRAIEATRDDPYMGEAGLWRILHALAGHDALFVERAGRLQPLQVQQGEPELRVRAEADGLCLELHPDCAGDAHRMLEQGPDQMVVYAFTDKHRAVSELLGAEGLKVPAGAREQVGRAAASLAPLLAVHADLPLGLAAAGLEEVPADPTPELDLRPWGEGLRAQLRVRPVPGGPAFVPGAGAGELLLELDGRRCRSRRDLAEEERRAAAFRQACASLEGPHWEWELDDPMACLGLMLELEPLKGQARIAWPEGESFRTPLRSSPQRLQLALRGEGQWFTVGGQLRLDEDRMVELQRLLDLLPAAKGDFLPLGEGQWLRLERHFRDQLEGLRALAVPHGSGLRLAPAAALSLEDLTAEVGQFTAPKAWKERAAAIRRAFEAELALPATLQATLRSYQEEGFHWLARLTDAGLGACLADDMGLGKTVQALALLLRRASLGPALVVAPTSVVGNWAVEARRFAPTLDVRVFGEGDRAGTLEAAGAGSLVLCSYGLLVQEQDRLTGKDWATVILDEAQAVKNAGTQRSKAVMALQAQARVAMSGTPVENRLGELWNLFRFLNPGLLGSAEHFTKTFALPIERDRNRISLKRLKRILQPFLLRRTKQEVLQELPPLTEIVQQVVLSAPERAFYETLRRRALTNLAGGGAPGDGPGQLQILAELMRLRRACCHSRLVEPGLALPSAKLEAFAEIVEDLRANRHRALVFSQFVDHLTVLRERLDAEAVPYQYLDGATPAAERRRRIDAFQAGEGDLFLISLKAGGTGLNLTAADYVIHMDPWWNPAVEDQASGRAHRIGQDRPVTVYRLVCKDTLEERILALHRDKRHLADGILEGAGAAAALSPEDLMALLRD